MNAFRYLLDFLANDCAANQCLNGATCVDGNDQFLCECADGYRGIYCEAGLKLLISFSLKLKPKLYVNGRIRLHGYEENPLHFC